MQYKFINMVYKYIIQTKFILYPFTIEYNLKYLNDCVF